MNIKFEDIVTKRKDLDLLEYEVNFIVEDSESNGTEVGTLKISMSGSFRPHIQASDLDFSDDEFNQYVWDRIINYVVDNLRIKPVKISPLRFRTSDINKDQAKQFKESTLPTLPDYTKKENRITTWMGDIA